MILANPIINKYYIDKKYKLKHILKDEYIKEIITEEYHLKAMESNINITLLDKNIKENINTEIWNENIVINSWLDERINNDTISMVLFNKKSAKEITYKYNTDNIGISGVNLYTIHKTYSFETVFFSIMLYPLFPVLLLNKFSNINQYEYYLASYNINTSSLEFYDYKYVKRNFKNNFRKNLEASLYKLKTNEKVNEINP